MLFGVRNKLLTYQKVVTKAFLKYLENFMMIFLNDFIVYIDMESHLQNSHYVFKSAKNMAII
jgi:hypothetical protein